MEIKKVYFMTKVETDQLDMEGNPIIINEDVIEDDLVNFIINNSYGVEIVGHYEKTFSDEIEELKYQIEDLNDENEELKVLLDSTNSKIQDALSELSDVQDYLEYAEEYSRY